MPRAFFIALLLVAFGSASVVRADTPPAEPMIGKGSDEPHKISVITQGAVGGAGFASAAIGAALLISAHGLHESQVEGGAGSTCRPCTDADLTSMRTQEYLGFGFLGLGGALLVVDAALIAIDAAGRSRDRRKVALLPGRLAAAVRF